MSGVKWTASPPLTACPFHVMLLKRRQPDAPAAAPNKYCPILTLNGLYTEFGIDPSLPILSGSLSKVLSSGSEMYGPTLLLFPSHALGLSSMMID